MAIKFEAEPGRSGSSITHYLYAIDTAPDADGAEECIGVVYREIAPDGQIAGYRAENYSSADLHDQRTPRGSAYQAAKDMWGQEAADAIR